MADVDMKQDAVPETKTDDNDAQMTPEYVVKYLMEKSKSNDALIKVLGSPDKAPWTAKECGDGNINYIFRIEGCSGSVVVKQAPPYIRLVGPEWQLQQQRLNFETSYTEKVLRYSTDNAPKLYLVDPDAFLFVMEDLTTSKMVVFRSQIPRGIGMMEFPNMGQHVGRMVANMLFKTSDLGLKAEDKWIGLKYFCGNNEMVGITEQVIFEEPYYEAEMNRFKVNEEYKKLCPQMIDSVNKMRSDPKVLRTVFDLRRKFRNLHQALVHGDLHTGSIMCNKERTVAIDAEFSYYGPMFVDVGQFIGNMLLSTFSQELYASDSDDRSEYIKYLCTQTVSFYKAFYKQFVALWDGEENTGNLIPKTMGSDEMRKQYKHQFMDEIWRDSIKFAGMVLIRRTLGIADGPEFRIDKERNQERWSAEEKAMRFGHCILNDSVKCDNIETVIASLNKFL